MSIDHTARLHVALSNSISTKAIVRSVVIALSARDEISRNLLLAALQAAETDLEMSLLTEPEGALREAATRALGEVRTFREQMRDQ